MASNGATESVVNGPETVVEVPAAAAASPAANSTTQSDGTTSLPRFLISSAGNDEDDIDIERDAMEDAMHQDNECDSDDEGSEVDFHTEAVLEYMHEHEDDAAVHVVALDSYAIPLREALSIHKPPPDWKPKARQVAKGEPRFENVHNPGKWNEYLFRPVFNDKTKKYIRHSLISGATPVPFDKDGELKIGGWEMHYNEWKLETTDPLPESAVPPAMPNF